MAEPVIITPAMRDAVRREECLAHGHSFSEVVQFGCLAPQLVMCNHCGSTWRIHPEDTEKHF